MNNDLTNRFPISQSVRKRNPHLFGCEASSPVNQSPVRHEPVAAKEGKGSDTKRLHVRIVSYRKRLCDADNLCPKYFVDCLRYAKIIKDDSAKYITLEVSQKKSKEEYTLIEVLEQHEIR